MEEYINQLCDILDQETAIYHTILEKSREKTDVVVDGKVQELDNIVKTERALVMQVGQLEQKREEVVSKIASILKLNNNLNMSQLIQNVPVPYQDKLRTYRARLESIIHQLREINEMNGKLITNALDYVEFSLNIITNASMSGNTYEKQGGAKNSVAGIKNLFDVKL